MGSEKIETKLLTNRLEELRAEREKVRKAAELYINELKRLDNEALKMDGAIAVLEKLIVREKA